MKNINKKQQENLVKAIYKEWSVGKTNQQIILGFSSLFFDITGQSIEEIIPECAGYLPSTFVEKLNTPENFKKLASALSNNVPREDYPLYFIEDYTKDEWELISEKKIMKYIRENFHIVAKEVAKEIL